jgi:hypothetical protein
MKDEWKMRPYLGVLPFVFSALRHGRACGKDEVHALAAAASAQCAPSSLRPAAQQLPRKLLLSSTAPNANFLPRNRVLTTPQGCIQPAALP